MNLSNHSMDTFNKRLNIIWSITRFFICHLFDLCYETSFYGEEKLLDLDSTFFAWKGKPQNNKILINYYRVNQVRPMCCTGWPRMMPKRCFIFYIERIRNSAHALPVTLSFSCFFLFLSFLPFFLGWFWLPLARAGWAFVSNKDFFLADLLLFC